MGLISSKSPTNLVPLNQAEYCMSLVNKILDRISDYFRLKLEKMKLELIAQVSRLLAHFIAFLFIGLIAFFFFTFLSLALGAFLNQLLQSPYLGYLIVAGIYLLVLILVFYLLKTRRLQNWLEIAFLQFSESLSEQEESESDE